eukprot:TRINITY_DN7374_c0_g1_i1.p1 TRINITY_DN7374_c0_g1~~TRINITY_DN7374_c0_g1_i1.p1  ORF type:complete len:490 (+),score=146.81 TRINITY_DN7374_c0_g1_i1:792-2261(+)
MAENTAPPAAVFNASAVIQTVIALYVIPRFFIRRNTFPIAQRLPEVVIFELTMLSAAAYLHLFAGAFPTSPFADCRVFLVSETALYHTTMLLLVFRVGWLFIKDFSTKLMKKKDQVKRLQSKLAISPVKNMDQMTNEEKISNFCYRFMNWFIKRCLERFNITQTVLLAMSIAIICAVADLVHVLANSGQTSGVSIYDLNCFELSFKTSALLKVLAGFQAFLLATVSLISMRFIQERLSLMKEVRVMVIPAFATVILSTCVSWSSGYQTLMVNSKAWIFLIGGFLIPLIQGVQSVYPLYLSIKHEEDEAFFKETKNLRRLNYSQVRESGLKQKLKASEPEQPREPTMEVDLSVEFARLLENDKARELFVDFLTGEYSAENLMFVEACKRYKAICASEELKSEAPSEAQWIYELYISKSSGSSVRLSEKTRRGIREIFASLKRIKRTEAVIIVEFPPDLFDEAEQEIVNLMLADSFQRFRITAEYQSLQGE